ncbi:MAG: YlxR family protein [Oscillospiraceae bacterium]|nr:YlxR family protein [Oscillospiraceae bacterium]
MQAKKQPLRMCTGCGEMKPKRELVRLVKTRDGEVTLDLIGKAQGRGAYICKNAECFAKAVKARRLEKAFSQKIPEEIYKKIEAELKINE